MCVIFRKLRLNPSSDGRPVKDAGGRQVQPMLSVICGGFSWEYSVRRQPAVAVKGRSSRGGAGGNIQEVDWVTTF